MPTKGNTRHATHWKITKNHVKKSIIFLSKFNLFSIIFGTDFQVRSLNVLGKARFWLRFPTMLGSKTRSERHQKLITKKDANMSPTWAPTWPQEASQEGPRGLPRRPKRRPKTAQEAFQEVTWPLLCLTSRPEPDFGTMLDHLLIDSGPLLDQVSLIFKPQ